MKKHFTKTLFAALCALSMQANAQIISTVAGTGTAGYNSDGIAATTALINLPRGICTDAAGNVYFADVSNQRIRKIDVAGIISTIAGTGTPGYNGEGIAATSAQVSGPWGICVSNSGDIYFSEWGNQRIRKISGGIITTIAGDGTGAFLGEGTAATAAEIHNPQGVAVDAAGNVYIADAVNERVRKVSPSGIITTIAGTGTAGYNGDGIPATTAQVTGPSSIAIDTAGNVYFSDYGNFRIRKINTAGVISTIGGNGSGSGSETNGVAATATIMFPECIALDAVGNIYIANSLGSQVRIIDAATGVINVFAGTGSPAFGGDGDLATLAQLDAPWAVCVSHTGHGVFIADENNQRIRNVNCTLASPGTILGADTVCIGSAITISDAVSGGAWSISNANATISPSGTVTGVAGGWDSVYYSVFNACGISQTALIEYVKNCSPTEVSALSANASKPSVYPNPTAGAFTLELPIVVTGNVSITITNLLGDVVETRNISATVDKQLFFDLSHLAGGTYLIKEVNGNNIYHEKVVKW